MKECIDLANACNAEIVGSSVLVDRSGGKVDLGVRFEALLTVDAITFDASVCPLCQTGSVAVKPGTSKVN